MCLTAVRVQRGAWDTNLNKNKYVGYVNFVIFQLDCLLYLGQVPNLCDHNPDRKLWVFNPVSASFRFSRPHANN